MKIAFFDTHNFEKKFFLKAMESTPHTLSFLDVRLTESTAPMAQGHGCVCAFVNDKLSAQVLKTLSEQGVGLIALRSAGFNHVDLKSAATLGIKVVRVPGYSPYAVAEHAVGLLLSLNRKIHRAYNRVREGNFSLEGLVGFDLHDKKIGVIGTGRIGEVFCKIMLGFGCQVRAFDIDEKDSLKKLGVEYTSLESILSESDVISLHVPLTPKTHHLIDSEALSKTKKGVILINTSRGALIETRALIQSLKLGHLGFAGLDVYEEEEGVFFENFSEQILQDDQLARLLTFPNVLLTSHQAFLTEEALGNIAQTTIANISAFESGQALVNEVFDVGR